MGRKKSATAAETPQVTTASPGASAPTNGSPTLAGAIVSALKTLGHDAETTAVKSWIQQNYPGIDVSAASFQSTLSVKRKAARGGAPAKTGGKKRGRKPGQKAAAAAAPKPVAAATPTGPEPTFSELLRAKQAADGQGGVGGLLTTVQSVRALADQAGGIDRLAASLEALQKLEGGK